MSTAQLIVLPDVTAMAARAAELISTSAQAAVAERGRFTIALAGGGTPRALFQRLAEEPYRTGMPWQETLVFWSDERLVPPDHTDSNYRLAAELLFAYVSIPAANIHLVSTVGSTPEHAAASYAETIRAQVSGEPPQFDIILLGIGPDGHTASLFPNHPALEAPTEELVVAVHNSPKLPSERISFTYNLINAARQVVVLASGEDKAAVVAQMFGEQSGDTLPVQRVQPAGELLWLVDSAAASQQSEA